MARAEWAHPGPHAAVWDRSRHPADAAAHVAAGGPHRVAAQLRPSTTTLMKLLQKVGELVGAGWVHAGRVHAGWADAGWWALGGCTAGARRAAAKHSRGASARAAHMKSRLQARERGRRSGSERPAAAATAAPAAPNTGQGSGGSGGGSQAHAPPARPALHHTLRSRARGVSLVGEEPLQGGLPAVRAGPRPHQAPQRHRRRSPVVELPGGAAAQPLRQHVAEARQHARRDGLHASGAAVARVGSGSAAHALARARTCEGRRRGSQSSRQGGAPWSSAAAGPAAAGSAATPASARCCSPWRLFRHTAPRAPNPPLQAAGGGGGRRRRRQLPDLQALSDCPVLERAVLMLRTAGGLRPKRGFSLGTAPSPGAFPCA